MSRSGVTSSLILVGLFVLSSMTPALISTTTEAASARSNPGFFSYILDAGWSRLRSKWL